MAVSQGAPAHITPEHYPRSHSDARWMVVLGYWDEAQLEAWREANRRGHAHRTERYCHDYPDWCAYMKDVCKDDPDICTDGFPRSYVAPAPDWKRPPKPVPYWVGALVGFALIVLWLIAMNSVGY